MFDLAELECAHTIVGAAVPPTPAHAWPLLAQRLGAWDAARIGTYLHGLAGDLGPDSGGLASELASRIPSARQALLSREARPDEPGTLRSFP